MQFMEMKQSSDHHHSNVTIPLQSNHDNVVQRSNCGGNVTEELEHDPFRSHDALLYIVVVLLFYAFSMVILMIKYIRRERAEAEMATYYAEYVSREKFKTPQYELQSYMKKLNFDRFTLVTPEVATDDEADFISCNSVPFTIEMTGNSCPPGDKPWP